jgi:hypothetical protein
MKNLIHPIAVALVGWYLMLPPATGQQGIPRLMVNAPIALWTIAESFDTSKACERELDVRRSNFERIYKKVNTTTQGRSSGAGSIWRPPTAQPALQLTIRGSEMKDRVMLRATGHRSINRQRAEISLNSSKNSCVRGLGGMDGTTRAYRLCHICCRCCSVSVGF